MSQDADLRQRIEDHLHAHCDEARAVAEVRPLSGGACQENLAVALADGTRLVVRSDARSALPGSIGRPEEFAVIAAARDAGAPTPRARGLASDLVRPGAWAYVLDWVEGEAIGARVVRGDALAAARADLPEQLAGALAAIHRVTPQSHPDLRLSTFGPTDDPVEVALAYQRRSLEDLPEPHPPLRLALRWLEAHRPAPRAVSLVHGDFRVGNFMVGPEGLRAVLDWEFAHWGNAHEDIGWLCVRDWRFGRVDQPAGGLCSRARFCRAYAAASGQEVDPAAVHFWEVLGNLRWAVGAVVQGLRYLRGAEADLELLAIARRSAEMEFEALRLIEQGPPTL